MIVENQIPLTLCGRQPITFMVRCQANDGSANNDSLIQPQPALGAELVLVLNQKPNPE